MTEEKKSMVPKLRFPEFTATWEQRKLEDICDVRDGTHSSPKYFDNGFPLVTSKNLRDGVIDLSDVQLISKEDYLEINKRSKVDLNDILMSMIGTIGNLALIKEEPTFAIKNVALIKSTDKVKMDYLFSYLSSPSSKCDIDKSVEGGTQKFLSLTKVRGLKILLPGIEEQQKIGSFSVLLDGVITLHQRKLEGLSKLKKSLLQKMFPKNGSLGPELRFPGFTGDWEQRKFYDCFKLLRNNSLARAELAKIGKIRNIRYGDVLINYPEVLNISTATVPFIAESRVNSISKDSYLENGDIVIADTAEDESVGKTTEIQGITDHKIVSGLHTIPCRPLVNFSPNFLGFLLNSPSYHDQLKPLIQGIKVSSISKKALGETRVCFAKDLDEQAQIGGFFNGLEMLITLHQRKLESLKKLKKSLLQQMFV